MAPLSDRGWQLIRQRQCWWRVPGTQDPRASLAGVVPKTLELDSCPTYTKACGDGFLGFGNPVLERSRTGHTGQLVSYLIPQHPASVSHGPAPAEPAVD